MHMQELNRF